MQFKQDITSETECVNQCRNTEEGCCVQEDGACTFTTRGACSTTSSGNSSIGFHKDMLCSNDALPCDCAKQQYTGCVGNKDEVYWFDSCNNRENIYNSDKATSYNRGYVLPKEKSCKLTNPNDPNCGNCDYSSGTLCGKASKDTRVTYGEYVCKDLNCKNIYENAASPSSGSDKKSGESWCLYDAAVGFGKDLVGSRQYRSLCINGEELSEPCEDYRRQICVQGILGAAPSELGESFKVTGSYVEAACRTNRWEDCTSCTTADCCNDISIRDCYWMPAGVTTAGGTCVPHVPPGLKFWEGESQSSTPSEDATSICEKASMQCTVKWERGGMSRLGLGSKEWKCIKNCDCLKKDYIIAANDYCKALGDCGAYYNIAGKATLEGFSQDTENTFTKADVGDWETLVEPSKAKESELSFQSTWKRSLGFTLAVAGISGAYTKFVLKTGWNGLLAGGQGIGALFQGIWPKSGGVFKTMSDAAFKTYGGEKITVKLGESLLDKAVTDAPVKIAKDSVIPKGFISDKSTTLVNAQGGSLTLEQGKALSTDGVWNTKEIISGKYTGSGTEGMTAAKDLTTTTTQPSAFAQFATWFQTIMWIYTIYNILDWLLKDTKTKTYTIKCQPWQAPIGGSDCEKCQESGKTCSEYRCKSLGKLCSLVNVGTPQEKMCKSSSK